MEKDDLLMLLSSNSMRVSLEAVRAGKAGLDSRRKAILSKVSRTGEWCMFEAGSLDIKDLAYFTAKTGDEFALLRGKHTDILFHGNARSCTFVDELKEGLLKRKFRIVGHSHPGEPVPVPSEGDRDVLRRIGQKSSCVISGMTGICTDFGQNPFEMPSSEEVDIFQHGGDENVDVQ